MVAKGQCLLKVPSMPAYRGSGCCCFRSTALKGTFGVLNVLVALFRGSGFDVKVRSVRTRSGH